MSKPLRVLLVEDSGDDAELVLREIRRNGYAPTWRRVDTPAGMQGALEEAWDVVISDHQMPSFNARDALLLAQAKLADVPFIIVSGSIGEEAAVNAMRAGAHDFVLKGELGRLGPALDRELREAELRREQAQLREQLLLADRMASVGLLAAGVAHEINNPLAALIGNLEYVAAELPTETEGASQQQLQLREALADAQLAASRIRHIVGDIKLFSRNESQSSNVADVRTVLDSALRMAQVELRHRGKVIKDYQPVPFVRASDARLSQVFLNLIINGAQALPEGRYDRNELHLSTRSRDGEVVVEIADTGDGIAPEVLDRIFDAFFTTKPVGKGTGLGLAISKRIVDEMGGTLEVESQIGQGTVFRVVLPASEGVATMDASVQEPPTPSERRATILVVDDDPLVDSVVRRLLSPTHSVAVVSEAQQALALLEGGARFDVVLCDIMMPNMTGLQLHAEVSRRHPELARRMLFLAGSATTAAGRELLQDMRDRTLEKPFTAAHLRSAIQRVINAI